MLVKMGRAGPPFEPCRRPQAGKSGDPRSQNANIDHRDYSASIRRAGWVALVLDPIIDGYHFTRVLMDGGSSLNLIYQDTVRKMGIDPTKILRTMLPLKE